MAISKSTSTLSVEEKRNAAALRKKEKAEKAAAEKASKERERVEKERADEIALQEAMAAAALERKAEEEKEADPGIVTPRGKDDDSHATDGNGKNPEESPEKKKSRTAVETPLRGSNLKSGRYARPSTPAPKRMHLHEHKRAIIEAGLTLDSGKRFEHLISSMGVLLRYGQMVDEFFTINPIYEAGRNKDWDDPTFLPSSMTELGAYLKLSGSPRIFEKSKGGQGNAKAPTVYFSFAVSSDVAPDEIMARIIVDWNLLGGTRLAVKHLGVFDTVTPVVIYFLWNEGHAETILRELQEMLSEMLPVLIGGEQETLPPMAL